MVSKPHFFRRHAAEILAACLAEPRRTLQVAAGPRQVGKRRDEDSRAQRSVEEVLLGAAPRLCALELSKNSSNHEVGHVVWAERAPMAIEVKSVRAPLAHACTVVFRGRFGRRMRCSRVAARYRTGTF